MNSPLFSKHTAACLIIGLFLLFTPRLATAHCDTMNGPVVTAAAKALDSRNVNLVLIWVQKKDEAEIRSAFEKTLAVRTLSPEARNLADKYFFETLVRIHRAGEGMPYTGLKKAEPHENPGIEAADRSLVTGSPDELLKHLNEAIHQGVHRQFEMVVEKKTFKSDDVEAGRAYVKAYVEFIHYVENLYQSADTPAGGHSHEAPQPGHH